MVICDECVTTKTFTFTAVQPNTVCTFRIAWELSSISGADEPISDDWDWKSSENLWEINRKSIGIPSANSKSFGNL